MSARSERDRVRSPRRAAGLQRAAVAVVGVLALLCWLTALALAAAPTVRSSSNSQLGEQVLVDARGHTLYELSPETSRHLLCKSARCTRLWPPLTVRSRSTKLIAGAGVSGHLAILTRAGGSPLQVTLNGHPLYRYANDGAAGEANGDGVKGFGGSWHVVKQAAAMSPTPMPQPTPSPPPPPTTPPYGY